MTKKRATDFQAAIAADFLLDDAGACRLLLTNPRTLRLWRRTLGLPFIRLTSKSLRYRRSDLEAWLNRRRVQVSA